MLKSIFRINRLHFLAAAITAALTIMLFSAQSAFTEDFKKYVMDNNYFSCDIPSSWDLIREKEKDEDYKIYEIQLISPRADKAPTMIFVSYYAKDNEDFNNYKDFLNRNSKNVLGETKNKRENYGSVTETGLNGTIAFSLQRERLRYLYPQSKSDESVSIKEQIYVVPAKEGFYVLHYSTSSALYNVFLPVFDRIVKTFRTKEQ
ncbi:MAG: hypothetical protein JXR79_03525 [Nitrospirae bacterium]|nr:hypothetical protein [Nitrospirota bacterium]